MATINHMPEIYYLIDENTRTVFWSYSLIEDRPDLIFLGSSRNPNKKMAVATFVRNSDKEHGYTLKKFKF